MTVFLRDGLSYIPTSEAALDMHHVLPAGNFIIKKNPMTGALYFEQIESFPEPGKLYGNVLARGERILNTFETRSASTGVLLNGEKGSGKTLLAKHLSQLAALKGYPTIVINAPWCGDQFNQLIQSLTQPTVILFDEFEKVYDREQQESILTLLDGVFPSKKLFILTCNDKYRIDAHMRNRPGRIFYMLDFKGLDKQFIREYCEDRLNAKEHINAIIKISMLFDQFNFDMLKALVEEMNRYNETPQEALEMLNAKPTGEGGVYDIELTIANVGLIPKENMYTETWHGSPVGVETLTINYDANTNDPDADDDIYITFDAKDLKKMDTDTGAFTYVNASGHQAVFKRRNSYKFSYGDFSAF